VGFAIADDMRSSIVTDALKMAWFRPQPPAGSIMLSDNGSQYCGKDWMGLYSWR
jgi:putative transposase